ncbi:hypothetical protein CAP35_15260 [Chitinophagaceae bacterium IBVUCB1]|nr:hypothetical protein CAP35_15260 [Chitinophagaceae bacterium IBVUCB1]
MHTTNYFNSFIAIAEDCPVTTAEVPPVKGDNKTVANLQFEMIADNPYKYTSDDVIFKVHALRNGIGAAAQKAERKKLFSKGQPCLRSSPLTKRYGWGVHSDAEGRVAIYAVDSKEYKKLSADKKLAHTKAMRSKKA